MSSSAISMWVTASPAVSCGLC
jgi:FGGY family of carbohydrate kinases, C-terminal domain